MKTKSNSSSSVTIGLDLGDRRHAVCVLDAKGGTPPLWLTLGADMSIATPVRPPVAQ